MTNEQPKISVVTPSYNHGTYLEDAISSLVSQNYPNLEYVVIDGGSTDHSVDIIRQHERDLAYWVSEPDNGQYDAINKGFSHTTGEIMAWLNADDMYTQWALSVVGEIFASFPEVSWITSSFPLLWDRRGRAIACAEVRGFTSHGFFRGENLPERDWFTTGFIQQESTFWRRSLWETAGGHVDSSLNMAGDFELWLRFFRRAELHTVNAPLGGFRAHPDQKTSRDLESYYQEAESVLRQGGGRPRGRVASLMREVVERLPKQVRWGFEGGQRKRCHYLTDEGRWQITRV